MILPPLGVFLILTSAYPSSKGIGAVFLIKFHRTTSYTVENNGNKVTLFVYFFQSGLLRSPQSRSTKQ